MVSFRHRFVVMVTASLVLALLIACSQGATPTPTPSPKQTPAPTTTPTAKPAPSPSPTAKATTAPAPAAVSFAGKTITIIGPTPAGGGSDIQSRIYARFLPRFLPGNPTVVVRNMPGGSNTIASNYAYQSKPDGLTLLYGTASVVMTYMAGGSAVKFDLRKMATLLGAPSGNWYYTRPTIAKQVEDLPKAKGIIFGHSATSTNTFIFIVFAKLVDIKPERVVTGYSGGADSRRAFLAGETNLSSEGLEAYESALAPLVAKGEVVALYQSGIMDEKGELMRDPGYPIPIPTGKEAYERIFNKPPSGTVWDVYKTLVASARSYNNLLLLPPGTPDAILRTYWDAAGRILKDPEFRGIIDPLVGPKVPWGSGEAYSKQFNSAMSIDPKVVEWLKAALGEYGVVL